MSMMKYVTFTEEPTVAVFLAVLDLSYTNYI